MTENEGRPVNSWLTNVVGLGFVILLLIAIAVPLSLMVDMLQYNPGVGLPVLAIGSGAVWLVTRLHALYFNRNSPEAIVRRAKAATFFGRVDWWLVADKTAIVLGIITGVGSIITWFK
jgi:hypothetical protein